MLRDGEVSSPELECFAIKGLQVSGSEMVAAPDAALLKPRRPRTESDFDVRVRFKKRQKVHCGGNRSTPRIPVNIGSRSRKRKWHRRETHVAAQRFRQDELRHGHCPGLPLHRQGVFDQILEAKFLQQGRHREEASVGGKVPALEVVWRGSPNFIGLRNDVVNPLSGGLRIDANPRARTGSSVNRRTRAIV